MKYKFKCVLLVNGDFVSYILCFWLFVYGYICVKSNGNIIVWNLIIYRYKEENGYFV